MYIISKAVNPIINQFRDWQTKREIDRDFPEIKLKKQSQENHIHLKAAMDWLCLAQDNSGCGGVSALYNLAKKSWGKPYRETTGYIIPTFLNYYKITGNKDFEERALRMGRWEIEEQMEDGAYGEEPKEDSGPKNKKVFNTGQVILGLLFLFDHNKENKYLDAAINAGNWLVSIQEKDGSWHKFTTQGPKVYHSRVAWPLLELYKKTGNEKFKNSAEKNLEWVLVQQNKTGWFENCSLSEPNKPWTHLIAYAIRGLLESSQIMESEKLYQAAYKPALEILRHYEKNYGKTDLILPGTFGPDWSSKDTWSCLTGNMQLAIIWLKLAHISGENSFREAAHKIIEEVKKTQILETQKKELRGAIAGSQPIGGAYAKFTMLNWATKFFCDALMMEIDNSIIIAS